MSEGVQYNCRDEPICCRSDMLCCDRALTSMDEGVQVTHIRPGDYTKRQ